MTMKSMNSMNSALPASPQPQWGSARRWIAIIAQGLYVGALTAGFGFASALATAADGAALAPQPGHLLPARERGDSAESAITPLIASPPSEAPHGLGRAHFEKEHATAEARHLADWVVDSGDSKSMPFVIVDKKEAMVFVFDAHGHLRGAAPALLGSARGDDAVAGIGKRALSSILPAERTTPAGRFVAALGRNLHGKEIIWVDYDSAISMHPVVTTNAGERRLQRLATPTPLDNRISYGCINVPAQFFSAVLHPAFTGTNGVVYVLPETRSVSQVFTSYAVPVPAKP